MVDHSKAYTKPHFHFNPHDPKASGFASHLMQSLGQYPQEDCDIIINIGGDGTILRALHMLPDIPSFAVKPPTSNSTLFAGHYKIETAEDLKKAFNMASHFELNPLRADMHFSDGSMESVHAYADIVARSFNAQAVLSNISVNKAVKQRVMGSGWIIATALGSTALNETQGGKVIPLESRGLVVTANGICDLGQGPLISQRNDKTHVFDNTADIRIDVSSTSNKRLTCVDYDSDTILPDGTPLNSDRISIDTARRHIIGINVHMDMTSHRTILLNPEYRTPTPF